MSLLPDVIDGDIVEDPTDEELAKADFEVVKRLKEEATILCTRTAKKK